MVAEMDAAVTGQANTGLAATLAEAEVIREEIMRNLSSTFGCHMVRSQISQGCSAHMAGLPVGKDTASARFAVDSGCALGKRQAS